MMTYGLPGCNLSLKESEAIQQPVLKEALCAMGYDSSFPWSLVFAHQDFGGFNIPHLHTEDMAKKVESMSAHIRASTNIGQSMKININTIQLLSGISTPIFKSNDILRFLDDNCQLQVRTFLNEINGKFEIKDIWYPSPQ